ncbi:hypothetical protein GLOIN_2v1780931 [Rhizophagus irregularis DAOM 181602=DAOM 197198]|uniref:Uncharacterized protein n=1 Tax=Rhizophagus irregularis (strain DAOM 181602 / DAOM 197198 / MUCL 43194) TaxID=747089 RepID=A0A2P4PLB3_RHIID|nr:hypothetical protein GLOIN_2v1780931 [Rhizophagus irregularis DAOM 181602=DAOM 197198]POG66165.1 hypothetical protein GLOIN_2v1780931 [Rhizophagus irregularis DAOM 181602=DAOM 197198]|eukprot:XP_025173031.1 hypothetical protein GLOIN_2v1780931 [Rhizophagus irregularis DAOM 181602=DAOM 197198]
MLEEADADLIGFFDELFRQATLASINNKYINGIKADIGLYLETSEVSASSIDILANIGLSVSRKTVNRQKTFISENHQYTVNNYCLQNIENMFILNIDNYHYIYRRNQLTLLKIYDINHFVTILLNSNPNIPKIPYYELNNIPIHNPKDVDFKLIINYINVNFISKLEKELRSMKNNKLVDFILYPLHNTKDYIEFANILFKIYILNFSDVDFLESIIKIWILFQRLYRHNYNKAPLIFLSDVFYWTLNNYPILNILKNNLPIFNDYFVKNFHSSLKYQTAESNTNKQIIQKAKTINLERNDNRFKNTFVNTRDVNILKVKLISLEKKVLLFLLFLFDKIYHNIGKSNNSNN